MLSGEGVANHSRFVLLSIMLPYIVRTWTSDRISGALASRIILVCILFVPPAEIVSFLYRPEYYQILQNEAGESNLGVGEIIVAKHRNGATDSVRLRFIGEYARFDNFDSFDDDFNLPTTKMSVNQEFDKQVNTYTVQSKMNSDEDNFDFDNSMHDQPF